MSVRWYEEKAHIRLKDERSWTSHASNHDLVSVLVGDGHHGRFQRFDRRVSYRLVGRLLCNDQVVGYLCLA